MPDLAVVVTTYFPPGDVGRRRIGATATAIRSWESELFGSDYQLIIADDGSDPAAFLVLGKKLYGIEVDAWATTARRGCGASLNAGVSVALTADAPAVFYAQDDWKLVEALDLTPSLALLNDDVADIVRFGPTHPNLAANVVRTSIPDAEWCLRYDWAGGGYVVGWRPALYHRRVFERFPLDGLEGLSAIEAERVWLERMAADPDPPRVFHAPNCTLAGPFRHIDTVELGEDDPATLTARYA